jgi:hypothetical protein
VTTPVWGVVDSGVGFSSAPVMFERSTVEVAPPVRHYWYYCTDPAGYFPYVESCSRAWIPVIPQPVTPAAD